MEVDARGGGTHDSDGNLVEDFGAPVNAMLAVYPTYRSLREACEAVRTRNPSAPLAGSAMGCIS
ncbi:hypothetical protein JKG47_08335 [Acidithiobacillus sp. MC6.1]|nr:hypothetical protein [Acidithiobacillus sp. MC6.1]